ncbi:MAG: hypothetical protein AAGI23_18400 [Bacteroidota bacterium]
MRTIILSLIFISLTLQSWAFSATEVQQVYERLIAAIGDQSRAFPEPQIQAEPGSVLSYHRIKSVIYIDQLALDICSEFGDKKDDALAFLLAHELTHFYQEHRWETAGFGSRFVVKKDIYNRYELDEKEADLFGAFTTHLADFQSIEIIPKLFDKVYERYQLANKLEDYPSLAERKSVAREVCQKTKELILIFESANYFHAVGEHLAAASMYEYLLSFVRYKELYNNIGVSLVAAAAQMMSPANLRFRYPLELDWDIPLRDGKAADPKVLLQKGIGYLSKATQLDRTHYRAFLNLSAAYTFSDQSEAAQKMLIQLQSLSLTNYQQTQVQLIQAIILAKKGATARAQSVLASIGNQKTNPALQQIAIHNLAVLKKESIAPRKRSAFYSNDEQIDGLDLMYQNELDFQDITLQHPFHQAAELIQIHPNAQSDLVHFVTNDKTIALLFTNRKLSKTKANVGVGSTLSTIQQQYQNGKILAHSRGSYLLFPQQKLFFDLDASERVRAWGIYEVY